MGRVPPPLQPWLGKTGHYAHQLAALQAQASDVLHGIPTEATYEEIIEALESRSQLKTKTQIVGVLLMACATTIEQLTHRAHIGLPEYYIRKEAAHCFINGIRDRDMKQQLLMGGERTLSKALSNRSPC